MTNIILEKDKVVAELYVPVYDPSYKYHEMRDNTGKSSASDLIRGFHSGHPNVSKVVYVVWEEGDDIIAKILYKENESDKNN